MRRLLHVSASPRGAASVSRTVGEEFAEAVAAATPGWTVTRRDLSHAPLPHAGPAFARANALAPEMRGPAEREALAQSEALIAEVEAADVLVISTPMHNYTVPSALKAWIDHVVRPGRTFRSTPTGKQGLITDRPSFAIVSCGGRLGDAPAGQVDFLTPYLRTVFATIGLSSLDILCLEEMSRGPEVERGLYRPRGRGRLRAIWRAMCFWPGNVDFCRISNDQPDRSVFCRHCRKPAPA